MMKIYSILVFACCTLCVTSFSTRDVLSSVQDFSKESGLQCYGAHRSLEKCLDLQNRCATVQFTITSMQPHIHQTTFTCADNRLCADPKAFCALMQKEIAPIQIANCSMACCSTNGCNAPTEMINNDVEVEERNLFKGWQIEHGKQYINQEEAEKRFQIFSKSLKTIKEFNNRVDRTWEMGLNEFSDRTFEEFASIRLMMPQNCSATKGNHVSLGFEPPAQINCLEKGNFVTAVKNQGSCGSCWTFSTTGCLESATAIHKEGNPLVSLSEQQLVDCAQAFNDHGCNGGLPSQAFEYIHYNKGLMTEADYPYQGVDGKCHFVASKASAFVKQIVNITKGNEDGIKEAVGLLNPVSIAFDVAKDFRHYKSGVYSSTLCGNKASEVNHAVLAVGYGYTSNGQDYWLVKNSWGPQWGINGYFKIERGSNMCGLADCASYPVIV
uniref:pro-cathepsin H-like n=1 Tax=Ciona intestinalis TaxID=7719 RepID=UPI000180D054|nr:pro-cathepsin H-like [Ciona intestinalis]|eukprot:XP_002128293.1 pro-cathepsin H-like [Ciona intestinalis]